jgi:hypothetical protein
VVFSGESVRTFYIGNHLRDSIARGTYLLGIERAFFESKCGELQAVQWRALRVKQGAVRAEVSGERKPKCDTDSLSL